MEEPIMLADPHAAMYMTPEMPITDEFLRQATGYTGDDATGLCFTIDTIERSYVYRVVRYDAESNTWLARWPD